MISIELTISATLTMTRPHTIFKWHLADWQSINKRLYCFSSTFISNYSIETEIQELWNIFKEECHRCLQLIPSCVCHLPNIRGLTAT